MQPDSIIPDQTNPQSWNRFSYVYNNSIRYTDPSGHVACTDDGYCGSNSSARYWSRVIKDISSDYGITFTGKWKQKDKLAVVTAVILVGDRFARERENSESASEAFRAIYGHVNFTWGSESATGDCAKTSSGGCTSNANQINFWSLSGHMFNDMTRMVKNVVHELGHAFDKSLGYFDSEGRWIQESNNMPSNVYYDGVRNQVLRPNMADGELSPNHYDWQQHPPEMDVLGFSRSETFADIFIAWTYNAWNTDPRFSNNVMDVRNYMNGIAH